MALQELLAYARYEMVNVSLYTKNAVPSGIAFLVYIKFYINENKCNFSDFTYLWFSSPTRRVRDGVFES